MLWFKSWCEPRSGLRANHFCKQSSQWDSLRDRTRASPMLSPQTKGTVLSNGLSRHHCCVGLGFRRWLCRAQEAGLWAEHLRFFRNADTQNAQCASVAGYRSSQNGHKTRADEPVVLEARDKSAWARENCLPVTASAGNKSRHLSLIAPTVQPLKLTALLLSDYPVPLASLPTK
jgi:hypothetical protein